MMMASPWLLPLPRVLVSHHNLNSSGISLTGCIWVGLLLAYCALIFYLSNQPMLPVPHLFNMQDKLIHAAAYAVLALLTWQAGHYFLQTDSSSNLTKLALFTIIFSALYGASDEWHQSFVAGRDASFFDWIADTAGALLLTLTLWRREVVAIGRE